MVILENPEFFAEFFSLKFAYNLHKTAILVEIYSKKNEMKFLKFT